MGDNRNPEYEVALKDTLKHKRTHTTSVALQSVVADPASNEQYIIDTLIVNGSASGTFQICDSSDAEIDGLFFNVPGGSGFIIEGKQLEITQGKGFKYTTVLTAKHNVIILYHKNVIPA